MTNPYQSPTSDVAKAGVNDGAASRPVRKTFAKRLGMALSLSLVVLASGPAIWFAFLVSLGALAGDPFRVFHNHIIWEDELVAKLPAALLLSSFGAIPVFIGILTERGNGITAIKNRDAGG